MLNILPACNLITFESENKALFRLFSER